MLRNHCSLGIPGIAGETLESLTEIRVDLDTYDIDVDPSPELTVLRRDLLATLSEPSIVVAYRPSRFLSSIQFARLATVLPAFLFQEQQAAFEHKPWVERSSEPEVWRQSRGSTWPTNSTRCCTAGSTTDRSSSGRARARVG